MDSVSSQVALTISAGEDDFTRVACPGSICLSDPHSKVSLPLCRVSSLLSSTGQTNWRCVGLKLELKNKKKELLKRYHYTSAQTKDSCLIYEVVFF